MLKLKARPIVLSVTDEHWSCGKFDGHTATWPDARLADWERLESPLLAKRKQEMGHAKYSTQTKCGPPAGEHCESGGVGWARQAAARYGWAAGQPGAAVPT